MIVGVVDGLRRVVCGQLFGVILTVNVVEGGTVVGEVGRLMDERSGPGVGTSVRDVPEGTAEADNSEFVGV